MVVHLLWNDHLETKNEMIFGALIFEYVKLLLTDPDLTINVSLIDMNNQFCLLANEVNAIELI
jgi:hypothetical protein